MAVKPIFDIATRAFNKAGARLLRKDVAVKLEEQVFDMGGELISFGKKAFHGITPPKGAMTGSFVQGEKAFGKEGFQIISFFDDNGKLIQRHRLNTIASKPKEISSSISNYSSFAYTDKADIFRTHTQFFNNDKLSSDKFTSLILDYGKPAGVTGTKTSCTLNKGSNIVFDNTGRNMDIPATKHLVDRFDTRIETVGNNPLKKVYEQSVLYNPATGSFTRMFGGKGRNISSEELALLNSDRYLPLRVHKGVNTHEYLMKDACARQNIPLDTPLHYQKIQGRLPSANTKGGVINIEYLGEIPQGARIEEAVDCLNHEAKHIYQHRIVADLNNGKIADPVLKHKAEIYKYEFGHYFSDYGKDNVRYRSQLIEQEAFEVGESASTEQYTIRRKIQSIFPQLNINILG